jgi:hypothetical protein
MDDDFTQWRAKVSHSRRISDLENILERAENAQRVTERDMRANVSCCPVPIVTT